MAVRRLVLVLAIGVALVSVILVTISTPMVRRHPERTPHVVALPFSAATLDPAPGPSGPSEGPATCDITVGGTTAADVRTATRAAGAGVVCFPPGRFAERIEADVGNQTWLLDPATVLAGQVEVVGPGVRIVGGTVNVDSQDSWSESVRILADDVTIERVRFRGGGVSVAVHGRDRVRITGNDFSGQSGTAIFIWGDGRGSDDVTIDGNIIDQSHTFQASPISSRAGENDTEGVTNQRLTIRGNTVDQGDGEAGWFGVELKLSPDSIIEGNRIRGGRTLISLADSDRSVVRDNDLDLTGSPYWGIEIASSDGTLVDANLMHGDGVGGDSAVSMNSGSLAATIKGNIVQGVGTLVDLSGDGHVITDNCLNDVRNEYAFRPSGGPNIEFARNGPCD